MTVCAGKRAPSPPVPGWRAAGWVRAADAENPAAQLELGRQLKEEKSPEAESRFAAVWNHEGAAAPLLSAACLELAGGYLAAGDIEKAGRLIEEAAARVPPETLYELYRVFRRKYPETARPALEAAAARKHQPAVRELERLRKQ